MRTRLSPATRREQIVKVAAALFEERGYAQVDIEAIRNAAGLSRGGFYHHFAAKADILAVIVDTEVTALADKISAQGLGGAAGFQSLILSGGAHAGNKVGILATLSQPADLEVYLAHLERSQQRHLRPLLIDLVLSGIATGEFASEPADHVADLFLSINARINRGEILGIWSPDDARAFAHTALKAMGRLLDHPLEQILTP